MIERAIVTESDNDFLDANAFFSQIFEYDDRMFPKSLKFSFLRKRSIEVRQIG